MTAKRWLYWINSALLAALLLVFMSSGIIALMRPKEIVELPIQPSAVTLPRDPFAPSSEDLESLGPPLLSLKFTPASMQLPDLKRSLLFYGKNGRPDADTKNPVLFFGFLGNKTPAAVYPNRRTFILYDRTLTPPQYVFSPNNKETPLWIQAHVFGHQAIVDVRLLGDGGRVLQEPENFAHFSLPEKEFVRYGGTPWEIGKFRVDGTLLARQRTKWYGQDLFLEKHGGKEYSTLVGKQRLDFGEGDEAHSVYVSVGDALIWDHDHWRVVTPGPASLNHPLMIVKKIDERLMNLELWDVDGKAKVNLNLLKSMESWPVQNIQHIFKFVGARTRSQFVFEINKERMLLSPKDWLLFHDGSWKKLSTPVEIDAYVERKTQGPLFVLDGVQQKEDQTVIIGTLFNPSRTEILPIEIPMQQGKPALSGQGKPPVQKPPKKQPLRAPQDDDEVDEDDDDEGEEE